MLFNYFSRVGRQSFSAALAVNQELILLYWQIGREILTKQESEGCGAKIIDRLARDLKQEFPDLKGFSRSNLKYMRAFADAYPERQIVQQLVGQIPWGHNVRLLELVKDSQERFWYIRKTIENGWSRNILVMQIESGLYQLQSQLPPAFRDNLPSVEQLEMELTHAIEEIEEDAESDPDD